MKENRKMKHARESINFFHKLSVPFVVMTGVTHTWLWDFPEVAQFSGSVCTRDPQGHMFIMVQCKCTHMVCTEDFHGTHMCHVFPGGRTAGCSIHTPAVEGAY